MYPAGSTNPRMQLLGRKQSALFQHPAFSMNHFRPDQIQPRAATQGAKGKRYQYVKGTTEEE
jgi:hypothetical protein